MVEMMRCGHIGCSYEAPTAAKRASHERSFNSHTTHFAECKNSCAKCRQMIDCGEWTDISAYANDEAFVDFTPLPMQQSPTVSFSYPSTPLAAVPVVATTAVPAPDVFGGHVAVVDFLRCSHLGCTWRSRATKECDKRTSVCSHERSAYKHRVHLLDASQRDNCPCCQQLLHSGVWRMDQWVVESEVCGKKRKAGAMSGDSSCASSSSEPPSKRACSEDRTPRYHRNGEFPDCSSGDDETVFSSEEKSTGGAAEGKCVKREPHLACDSSDSMAVSPCNNDAMVV